MIGLLKNQNVNLSIRMIGNFKRTSGNSLSPLGAQNKVIDAALTEVKLRLRSMLYHSSFPKS